ncbi:MAG: YHS domain-containing protein [Chloroflexi bacterium]|nr:YHS domain-containing protein [Chloroflexota bacterium]
MAKDPVCGMQVDEKKAPSTTHGGQKYYFCCDGCKSAFEKDPAKFLGGQGSHAGHGHGGH